MFCRCCCFVVVLETVFPLEIRVNSQMMSVTCFERKLCFLNSRRNHRMDQGYRYSKDKLSQVGKTTSSILEEIKMLKNVKCNRVQSLNFCPPILVPNVHSSRLASVRFNFIVLHMSQVGWKGCSLDLVS